MAQSNRFSSTQKILRRGPPRSCGTKLPLWSRRRVFRSEHLFRGPPLSEAKTPQFHLPSHPRVPTERCKWSRNLFLPASLHPILRRELSACSSHRPSHIRQVWPYRTLLCVAPPLHLFREDRR